MKTGIYSDFGAILFLFKLLHSSQNLQKPTKYRNNGITYAFKLLCKILQFLHFTLFTPTGKKKITFGGAEFCRKALQS